MQRIVQLMMLLIKSEITEDTVDFQEFLPITEETLKKLYILSSKHSVEQIVGTALKKNSFLSDSEISKQFEKKILLSVVLYERMNAELQNIKNILENANIPYLPLKGARIRSMYPEPYYRSSCDIDVLVPQTDVEKAEKIFIEKYNYTLRVHNYHDISLFSPHGIHLELHFSIQENMANIDQLLSKVWEYSVPLNKNDTHEYQQTNEYFVFHNLAHMAYHFVHGGCGVRPFIDVYLLLKNFSFDQDTVRQYCSICEIETFYDQVIELIDVWFNGKTHTSTTKAMEDYVISGGVFGTEKNRITVERAKNGSKARYLLKRIFMPYNTLKLRYPIIEKYKFLTPFYEIVRWFSMLFHGKLKRSLSEAKVNQNIDASNTTSISNLLDELGLH